MAVSVLGSLMLLAAAALAADQRLSVLCRNGGTDHYSCSIQPFSSPSWSARGAYDAESINTTGWGRLVVEGNGNAADDLAAFGTGFLEGYLTQTQIDLAWIDNPPEVSTKAADFITKNLAWVGSQAKSKGPTDAYWHEIGLVLLQEQGLYDGYVLASKQKPALTADQMVYLGLQEEIGDIEQAVNPSARTDYSKLSKEEFFQKIILNTHCSAIFKVKADFSDIFASHDTWSGYTTMLRFFKTYSTVGGSKKTADLHFSGYPGMLASIDDFYLTSQKIVAIETTNSVFNNTLYDNIHIESVPYWIRVTVAGKLATTAQAWHDLFYRDNSGTYNNQWMTLDYKLFTPGQPLPPGLFWVSEQLPGYYHSEDQTSVLQRGYWPSYNVPFYQDIYDLSGYPAEVKAHGPAASYQLAPRASLFRRDAGKFDDLPGLQSFMLSNYYGTGDPLASSPFDAIASRGDLEGLGFGAIDSKITSHALASNFTVLAISGPTHTTHPPFSWTGHFADLKKYPRYGQPTTFNFDWVPFAIQPLASNATRL